MNSWDINYAKLADVKVGDKVIVNGNSNFTRPYIGTVTRVLKASYEVDNKIKFNANGIEKGGDTWHSHWAVVYNEEEAAKIAAENRRLKLIYYMQNVKWKDISDENLIAIYNILKNNPIE